MPNTGKRRVHKKTLVCVCVCAQLHFNMCKETGVQLDNKHRYEHVPKSAETSQEGKVTILWNQQIQTDRTVRNNKPDIIIRDNGKGTIVGIIGKGRKGNYCGFVMFFYTYLFLIDVSVLL